MRWIFLVAVVLFAFSIVRCNSEQTVVEKIIHQSVPASLELDKYPMAYAHVAEQVELCGPGVIEGATDEKGQPAKNSCGHTIRVNSEFVRNLQMHTGLLPDEDWPYKDGISWVQPSSLESPAEFDIRELMKNGQPDLRQQQCGDCWAWATHHGLELARAVHDQKVYDHSVQTVLSCSGHGSCGGGYMSAPLFMVGKGLPLESQFPYLGGVTGKCKFSKEELAAGWDGKIIAAPNVGSSLSYSRALKQSGGVFAEGTKVKEMRAAIYQWKSPLVVTVSAYDQSSSASGPVTSCSAINSGGNHMVAITGWRTQGEDIIAHVWNSWGKGHGDGAAVKGVKTPGVSSIKWECGDGRLNRGLGVAARVIQYRPPCQPPEPFIGKSKYIMYKGEGNLVKMGKKQPGIECHWSPSTGIIGSPDECEVLAAPEKTTEYHLIAKNDCGTSSAMTLVEVWGPLGRPVSDEIVTPSGVVKQ